jgi:DNA-directed RNA polymerase specialized sigma24 family protein
MEDDSSIQDLPAFVCGTARHVISDMRRRTARESRVDVSLLSDHDRGIHSTGTGPEAEEGTLLAMILQEIDQLPESDQRVLKHCFLDGYSCAELSRQSGEPAPRIRKRKWRAVQRLKTRVRESPDFTLFFPQVPH